MFLKSGDTPLHCQSSIPRKNRSVNIFSFLTIKYSLRSYLCTPVCLINHVKNKMYEKNSQPPLYGVEHTFLCMPHHFQHSGSENDLFRSCHSNCRTYRISYLVYYK